MMSSPGRKSRDATKYLEQVSVQEISCVYQSLSTKVVTFYGS